MHISRKHRSVAAIVGLAGGLIAASSARAAFVPVLTDFISATNGDTTFIYSLNFVTDGSETLQSGDSVTLYDVGVTYGRSLTGAGAGSFTFTTPLVSAQPAGTTLPTDNPAVANLTLTYNGATLSTNAAFTLYLDYYNPSTTTSQVNGTRTGQFTNQQTLAAGKEYGIGPVVVPNVVPEPAMLGAAAVAAAGLLRRRRA